MQPNRLHYSLHNEILLVGWFGGGGDESARAESRWVEYMNKS